jgi:hypothetical protein
MSFRSCCMRLRCHPAAQEDHPLQAWQVMGVQALPRQQGDI